MNWKKARKNPRMIWIIAGISFIVWMIVSMHAKGFNNDIFTSNLSVQVEIYDDYTSFAPTSPFQKVMIFYPGAQFDSDAYAPLAQKIAVNGDQAMIIHMPWRMATREYNKIKKINLLAN